MHKQLSFYHFLLRACTIAFIMIGAVGWAQTDYEDEDDLKKGAEELFEEKKFTQAAPLYSQLVSLYPKDPTYNYKYGACLIEFSPDPEEALTYLEFATSRPDVAPEAYFFLAKAYHVNYAFKAAIDNYERFKKLAKSKKIKELNPDREIANCQNGLTLLRNLTDIVVYEKNTLGAEDFFRSYNLEGFGGKLIVKPEDFQSDYEKKNDISTVLFLPDASSTIYFSYIEGKGENGRDIYYATKNEEGEWGEPQKFEAPINTEFDEDFAFMHPNGRELYFSSKGHNSMGGYDVFRTFLDPSSGKWSEPVNLDFAINTPYDDFLFLKNLADDRAYFASNRFAKGGQVNVYKIAMERVPLDFTAIQGNFSSPTGNDAAITVEDMYSNTTLGTYETDGDGDYAFKLPSSGKFRFLVEQEGSNITHAGVVELKNQDSFSPLKQKMEIINENGEEKLIITNLLDEEPEEGELPLATSLIKEQAKLDVNYEEKEPQLIAQQEKKKEGPELVVLEEEKEDGTSIPETDTNVENEVKSTSTDGAMVTAEAYSQKPLPELAAIGNDLVSTLSDKSVQFEAKADIAASQAEQFNQVVSQKEGELKAMEATGGEGVAETQPYQDLNAELQGLQKQAKAAENLKTYYQEKAEEKRTMRDLVDMQAQSLNGAVANDANKDDIDNFEDIASTLSQYTNEDNTFDNLAEESYSDLLDQYQEKQQFINGQQQYIEEMESALERDKAQLDDLKAQREAEPKKRKRKKLTEEIEGLERSYESSEWELSKAKEALTDEEYEREVIKEEIDQVGNVVKQADPTFSDTQKQKALAEAFSSSSVMPEEVIEEPGLLEAVKSQMGSVSTTQTPQVTASAGSSSSEEEPLSSSSGENELAASTTSQVGSSATETSSSEGGSADIDPSLQPVVSNFNYESDYNKEFFLPVPDGAELPLTASTDEGPTLTIPEPVDETMLPLDNEFAGDFTNQLAEANAIEDEVKRDNTKGDILNQWANKIDTELFFLKQKRRKTGNENKKAELSQEIEALEQQKKEIEEAADQSFTRASYKQNEDLLLTDEGGNDPVMQKQLEYQNLNNVVKSSYNKEYAEEFTNIGEIENDYLRLFKTKDLNERWVEDIEQEVKELEAIAANDNDPKRKRITEERINSLNRLKGLKEAEIDRTNDMIVQYAFQNPADPNMDGGTGITKKRADALAAQSQNLMVNSIMLSDSASRVQEPELRSQLIQKANSDYNRSKELAEEASNMYMSLNKVMTASSKTVAFDSEQDLKSADYEELAQAKTESEAGGSTEAESNPNLKVSPGSFTGPAAAPAVAEALLQNAQNKRSTIDQSITTLSQQVEQETDPAKKAALQAEVDQLRRERRLASAEVQTQQRQANVLKQAEQNATTNPSANNQLMADLNEEATVLQATIKDSLAIAQNLRLEAESTSDDAEKQRLIKQAETIEDRMQGKQKMADGLLGLVADVNRVQKVATVKQQIPATLSDFNFPTANKTLTEAEVKEIASSNEWKQFSNMKQDYQRVLKEAEIMFQKATTMKEEGQREIKEATVLREQAAQTTDLEERKRLLKEADVLERSGKAKLNEAKNMETAGAELAENAIEKKKELEIFVATLDPALAAMVVAYDAGQTQTGSTTTDQTSGTLADAQPNTSSNEPMVTSESTSPQPATSSTTQPSIGATTSSASGSDFYAASTDDLNVTYDPETRALFKIGDANTAYYNEAQPIQFNPELPSGLVYKVQIGAFSKRVPPENFRGFAPITAENIGGGLTRYTAGLFEVFGSADAAKDEIRKLGYSDAFVVAYYNGKRISVSDARDMRRFAGAQPARLSSFYPGSATSGTASTAAVSSAVASSGPAPSPTSLPNTTPRVTPVTSVGVSGSPVMTNMQNLKGTFYTVQVGVFSKPVSVADLNNISPLQVLETDNGFFKYHSGVFDNLADAVAAKNKIVQQGIEDAFVTAYSNQNRVSPQAAQQEMQSGGSNLSSPPASQSPTSTNGNTGTVNSGANAPATFRVQVGAYQKDIPVEQAKVILGLTKYGVDIDESQSGLTKYMVGRFNSYEEANNFKLEMVNLGLSDAFVVAFQNGRRIDTEKARQQNGN